MDVFNIAGKGVVVVGIVKSGEISEGMWGDIEGIKIRVLGIEFFNKKVVAVREGQNCGLLLEGVKKEDIKKGQVIYFE